MNLRRLFVLPLVWSWTCVCALAAEPVPSWRLVPDETMLLVRIPGGSEFIDTLRRQTKFGKLILSPERIEKLVDVRRQEGRRQEGTQDAQSLISQALAQIDLKGDDYLQLLDGELGIALVAVPRAEHGPLLVGLGWLEPKGDLAERLVTSIQKTVEEQKDGEHPVRRIDLDLAGHTVTHLSIPVLTPDMDEFKLDFTPGEELTAEKIQERQTKLEETLKNAKKIETGRANVFFTRIENRVLLCGTFPEMSRGSAGDGAAEAKPDFDVISGVEEATGVFARFLEAHSGQGGDTTPPILAAPGLDATFPEGVPLVEIVGDLARVLKLAETVSDPTLAKLLEALGLDTLGAVAIRTVLDGTALRTATFISAPAPRHGLLTLLDQPALPAEPPDWAPASALAYQHINLDLGKVYSEIKDLAVAYGGEQAKQTFEQVEGQFQAFLQTDVAGLLSSLGQQLTVISFPSIPAEPAAASGFNPLSAALAGIATARTGFVWQVKDEQGWKRLMQLIGTFAPQTGGIVTAAEEQGFSGFRVKQDPIEAGFFLGRGYLVIGIGKDVTESLLAVLRSPPSGAAALRSGSLIERAYSFLAPEAGLEFALSDGGQEMKGTRESLVKLLSGSPPVSPLGAITGNQPTAPEDAAMIEKLKALLPSDEELEGSVGVSVGQTFVNSYGLVRQSVVELPAP